MATLKAHAPLAESPGRPPGDFGRILAAVGTATPIPGDDLPETWLSSRD